MKTITSLLAMTLVAASLYAGSALACDTCGCQDGADAAADKPAACADCPMSADCACGPKAAACADCPMNAECACAPAGCPFTHSGSHGSEELPDWHAKSPADLNVRMQNLDAFEVAYIEGTFGHDMDALYGELMARHLSLSTIANCAM